MQLDVHGYTAIECGPDADPQEFLTVLNSDPSFVEASTLNTGKTQFDLDDAAMFLWQSEVMEHSHLFAVREPNNRLVAVLTVLVPHPNEQQPWVGALCVHNDLGFGEVAVPVLDALETRLAVQGWQAIYVSPMASQRDLIEQWRAYGYVFVEARLDNNERTCWCYASLFWMVLALFESLNPGQSSTDRQQVNLASAFVSRHRFQVRSVTHDRVFASNAIRAQDRT